MSQTQSTPEPVTGPPQPAAAEEAASGAPGAPRSSGDGGEASPVGEERWAKRHQWKLVGGAVLAVGAVAVALGVVYGTGAASSEADGDELNVGIIGGSEAVEDRYSYAVSLQDDEDHFCGGSMIARDVVLSAAHCAGGRYKAIIGKHSLKDKKDGDEVDVAMELPHPDYDDDTTDNDFMLLFLERATTEDVALVRVSPDVVPVGTPVTAMGWGVTSTDDDEDNMPTELMEVEVYVISNEECDDSESKDKDWEDDYNDQITDNMVCAKDEGEDSCQGDSGGPLVVRSRLGVGTLDTQVGISSWGVGCAHPDFPGVYARVSAQYDWIRRGVCENSSDPPASFDCENA